MADEVAVQADEWEQEWNAPEGDAPEPVVAAADPAPVAEEPPAEEPPLEAAPEGEQPPVEEPAEQPAPDPMASVNAAIVQLTQGQQQLARTLQQQVGQLSSQMRVNAEAAAARAQPPSDGPSQKQIAEAAKTPEGWAKLKQEWPEWATPLEQYIDERLKALPPSAGQSVDPARLEQEVTQRVLAQVEAKFQAEKAYESARAEVIKAHPDFDPVRLSPQFQAWVAAQSPGIQALGDSMHPADAIHMMNLYKATLPRPAGAQPSARPASDVQAQRQARLARAVAPSRSVAAAPRQGVSFEGLSWDETWALDDQLKGAAQASA